MSLRRLLLLLFKQEALSNSPNPDFNKSVCARVSERASVFVMLMDFLCIDGESQLFSLADFYHTLDRTKFFVLRVLIMMLLCFCCLSLLVCVPLSLSLFFVVGGVAVAGPFHCLCATIFLLLFCSATATNTALLCSVIYYFVTFNTAATVWMCVCVCVLC